MNILEELQVFSTEIVLLQGNIPKRDQLRKEAEEFRYHDHFFNTEMDISHYVKGSGARVIHVDTAEVNNPAVLKALESCHNRYFIFTGGGILAKEILEVKQFIHIHPGIIPKYRGSTCFYYSLLTEYSLGTTAFIMNENIDTGDIILTQRYRINYHIHEQQKLFLDFIVDPYIRAITLKKVLTQYMISGTMESTQQPPSDTPAYYVMHPLLRHLTIRKINSHYNNKIPQGVTVLEG